MKTLLVLMSCLMFTVGLSAQTLPTIDSYYVRFYAPGAPQPLQVSDAFQATSAVCNQPLPAQVVTVNPARILWDDPLVTGRVCIYTVAQGGSLFSLPVGNYEGTLAAVNSAGTSAESNRASFSRASVVSAPTGVRIVR